MASEVAARMCDEGVAVVLVNPDDPAILTEHDLIPALVTPEGPATPASELATPDPYAAWEHETVLDATCRMLIHRIRHLVVIRADGSVAGVLALGQAAEALVSGVRPSTWAVTLQSTTVESTVSVLSGRR